MLRVAFCVGLASAADQCCWSRWGDASSCGNYPPGGNGPICGNDGVTVCGSNADCDGPVPTPVPMPVPTPAPMPTPVPTPVPTPSPPLGARVVGYIPTYRVGCLSSVDYSALTHVIASFLEPPFGNTGTLQSIVSHAKSQGIEAFVAIGGGAAAAQWPSLMSDENAQSTADKIVAATLSMGADGIDVDLEGDLVLSDTYNSFVATLSAAAKAKNLGLSAALAKWTASQNIRDETLALFDFVNLMTYDYKGPWNTIPPLQHSSFAMAQDELTYYIDTRGLPGSKVVLGVPFYGYDFSDTSHVTDFTWSDIVNMYPEHMNDDNFGGKYYNGKATIRNKTALARSRGAGVMIWELGQDVSGPDSLLQQIKLEMGSEPVVVV